MCVCGGGGVCLHVHIYLSIYPSLTHPPSYQPTNQPTHQPQKPNTPYQIEHRLFPTVPSDRLPLLRPLVQAICRDFGVDYREFPSFWGGLAATHMAMDARDEERRARVQLLRRGVKGERGVVWWWRERCGGLGGWRRREGGRRGRE